MAKEEISEKKGNKFGASLALTIVMVIVCIVENALYFLYDEESTILTITVSVSFGLSVCLLVWFIWIAAWHKKVHGATIAVVGIFAFTWLISSLPLFSAIMSSFASNGTSLRDFEYSFLWFDVDFFTSSGVTGAYLPYINALTSIVLLLIVPGLFSNEHIAIKQAETPEIEAVVSENGELKRVDHRKNRYRLALTLCIFVTAIAILGTILIVTSHSGMLTDILIEIFVAIFLFCILLAMIPINKRIGASAFVFISIFIVMLLFTAVCIAVLYSTDISHDEYTITTNVTFFVGAIRASYTGVPFGGGEVLEDEILVPYIDLVVSVISLIITSILFGKDRKKILNLKKEIPAAVEK